MPWLSLPEYARQTGTPESTVRAMIRDGRLRAELEQRAPGDPRTVWRVWRDDPLAPAADASSGQPPSSSAQESDLRQAATTEPSAAITGLLALIEADRATIRAHGETIVELSRRLGDAEASARMLAGQRDDYATWLAEATAELDRLRRRRWWRFWAG